MEEGIFIFWDDALEYLNEYKWWDTHTWIQKLRQKLP